MIEIDDVEDALKRADELAEITGRDKKDVIADLLDDGQLNMSAGEDIDNKDFLDIAQEKADKLKALLMTLLPLFAIIVGGTGFEIFGVTDFSPMGDDDEYQQPYDETKLWGCTDPAATNYEDWANEDDDSCDYEELYQQLDIQNIEISLVGDDELKVEFDLYVEGDFCCDDIELIWDIVVDGMQDEGLQRITYHSYDEEGHIHFEQYWAESSSGNYHSTVSVEWMNDLWDEETSNSIIIEDEVISGCTDSEADNYNEEATDDDGSCTYPPPPCQWIIWRGEAGDNATAPAIFHNTSANTTTFRYDIDENKNCGEYTVYVDLFAVNGAGDLVEWVNQSHQIYGQEYENDTLTLYNLTCNREYDLYLYLYDPDLKAADNFVFYNVQRECET